MIAAVAVLDRQVEIAAEAVPNAAIRPMPVGGKTREPRRTEASRTSRP
jgi:hypothetical protein